MVEHERWLNTDDAQAKNLQALLKKKKNKLSIDDWIIAMTSWGIPADKIAELAKTPIPGNLYYEIATRQEKTAIAPAKILYNTVHIPETVNMYYTDGKLSEFTGTVLDVFCNVLKENKRNLLILDQSAFYPTSGGQLHDTGSFEIETLGEFKVIDVIKVGRCVLHELDLEIPETFEIKGKTVKGTVNMDRRAQL